mgnify:CR=1 FL=1
MKSTDRWWKGRLLAGRSLAISVCRLSIACPRTDLHGCPVAPIWGGCIRAILAGPGLVVNGRAAGGSGEIGDRGRGVVGRNEEIWGRRSAIPMRFAGPRPAVAALWKDGQERGVL